MSLPTLLLKGNLVATKWSESQDILDGFRPVDYIMQWFDKRVARDPYGPGPAAKTPADRILVVRSSTGSGKSTVMPSELFHTYYERTKRNIACTQPRVFNAISIPVQEVIPYNTKDVLRKLGLSREPLVLEENIGYQTKAFTKKPTRGLIYMTIGVLAQQMKVMSADEFMQRYAFVIIDEAHERSIDTDFVLRGMKQFIERNYTKPNCPFLIVTSATFDVFKFTDYLLGSVPKTVRYQNIIDVKGFSHKITDTFLEYPTQNFIQSAVDTVAALHRDHPEDFDEDLDISRSSKSSKTPKSGSSESSTEQAEDPTRFRDILVFVSGAADIKKIMKALDGLNSSDPFFKSHPVMPIRITREDIQGETMHFQNMSRPYKSLRLDSGSSSGHASTPHPVRRVMVATNVGETGITYPNLKYVVDTGFHNSSEFNPTYGVEMLINKPVTRGMYKQRRGRAGRNAPGQAFAMYPESVFTSMREDSYPDIVKEDITLDVLGLIIDHSDPDGIYMNMRPRDLFLAGTDPSADISIREYWKNAVARVRKSFDLSQVDLLDSPSADTWHYCLEKLFVLGAVDADLAPTRTGHIINKFRQMRVESIRMILAGYAWGAPVADLITIACCLEQRKSDIYPRRAEKTFAESVQRGELTLFRDEYHRIPGAAANKTELLMSDDFIQYVLVFSEFQRLAGSPEPPSIIELTAWAESHGLNLGGLLNVVTKRDDVMQLMATIGLDPYHRSDLGLDRLLTSIQNVSISDIESYVRCMKQCIFEGFKLNLAAWDDRASQYVMRKTHLSLNIAGGYPTGIMGPYDARAAGPASTNPKYIIVDSVRYMRGFAENVYEPLTDNISVMDGFIPIDTLYDSIIDF